MKYLIAKYSPQGRIYFAHEDYNKIYFGNYFKGFPLLIFNSQQEVNNYFNNNFQYSLHYAFLVRQDQVDSLL